MLSSVKAKYLIIADFKTFRSKFSAEPGVDSYIKKFKDLKARNKIKTPREGDIDFWIKKPWSDFKEFVDSLEITKTKTELRKEVKTQGADKVAENKSWIVYKILTYEASKLLGKGTKWCITQEDRWESYREDTGFYFVFNKKTGDKFALSVSHNGKQRWWDAKDNTVSKPKNLPPFNIEEPEFRIKLGSKWVTLTAFSKMTNVKVPGDLDLRNTKITELPKDLKVPGNLYLSHTNITKLSEGLEVGGSLYLSDTKITELPNDLKVGGSLNLEGTKITELPEGLKVPGNLYLSHTNITKLPEGLKVGGDLGLSLTNITELPKGLKVGGSLNLSYTKITKLPEGLEVGGNLYHGHTNITELPEDLNVGGEIRRN